MDLGLLRKSTPAVGTAGNQRGGAGTLRQGYRPRALAMSRICLRLISILYRQCQGSMSWAGYSVQRDGVTPLGSVAMNSTPQVQVGNCNVFPNRRAPDRKRLSLHGLTSSELGRCSTTIRRTGYRTSGFQRDRREDRHSSRSPRCQTRSWLCVFLGSRAARSQERPPPHNSRVPARCPAHRSGPSDYVVSPRSGTRSGWPHTCHPPNPGRSSPPSSPRRRLAEDHPPPPEQPASPAGTRAARVA